MPEVVPTAGSKVEPTEIPDIADQPLMQAQATTEAADQEMIETQAAVQNSNGLDQSGDVVSQDLGRGWGCKVDIWQLFTELDMASGGYLPRLKAVR